MAANFIHGAAIKLHHRLFLIPWANKSSSISCGRDYCSSVPVKYIRKKISYNEEEKEVTSLPVKFTPKKSVEDEGKEVNSLPVENWGKIHNVHVPRIDVVENSSISLGDMQSKSHDVDSCPNVNSELSLDTEEKIEGDLGTVNEELTVKPEETVQNKGKRFSRSQPANSRQDVENLGIELLAARAFTALELKNKLRGNECPADVVDAVVTDFQRRGLINDGLYAETYSRLRWSSSSWGPGRIRHGLSKKGVCEADVFEAIKQTFNENNEECSSGDPNITMSKPSLDQLYTKAAKQWQRSHNVHPNTRKARMVRWLQYRGFNWSVVKYVLNKLESSHP